jgi:outer membrane protein OmpA-like peptidoglycan-associated protein
MSPRSAIAGFWFAALLGAMLAAPVIGDPIEVGGFFGPRRFASDVIIGDGGDGHTSLASSVEIGPRIARPLFPWLVPELEVALSSVTTREFDVGVFWIEPRALLRIEMRPRARLRPFVGLGVGMATALSSKRGIYDGGLAVDGFVAAGLGWNPGRGVAARVDIRASALPARADAVRPIAFEGEVLLGIYVPIGGTRRAVAADSRERVVVVLDRDGDGVLDDGDACIDRAEDQDGFEDRDGCPDIDNDRDRILDIADKCRSVAEVFNGFDDDDGCPDVVPADVDGVVGTLEGLLYREGDTEVRTMTYASLDHVARVMTQHPNVRLKLIGHTDDREAAPPPVDNPPADGSPAASPPADLEALSHQLGIDRATAVAAALASRGIGRGRLIIDSAGANEPVSDNDTVRGRLRNRRVDVRLNVPKYATALQ